VNVTMLLDMAADGFPERPVVGRRELGLTASRLLALAGGGGALIRSTGASALVYLAVNGPAFPVALFAAARAGVPLVPVSYRLGEEQLLALLARHPGALVITDEGHEAAVGRAGLPSRTPAAWLAEAETWAATPEGSALEEVEAEGPAVIIYTSGTTSAPKGVLLEHDNLLSYVLNSVEFGGADADEAALMSVPPYHIAAVSNVLTNLYAGRRFIVLEQFTAQRWLEIVRTENVTQAMVVPTMLARIMEVQGPELEVPALRSLAYGGARMPEKVIEQALRTWPHVDFVNAYGLTETSSTIAVLGPQEHRDAFGSDDPAVRARLRSVGRVVPAIEMQVRDEEGQVLPAGESGRIWVRGEQVSGKYAGGVSSVGEDGFFDTRDRGHLDSEGYLFLEGRIDDTIIRGAENIAPAEIEEVLMSHPDVSDAVVVGIPDDEWGQRIEAVVVPATGHGGALDTEALRAYVRARLRGSRTPAQIVCWSDLPRTVTGKILRRQVVSDLVKGP
jgi:acyl-CoA synthetase (AMP-forming)/AMP-acid ligase II